MTSGLVDIWASGDAYERYMGRWSRPVAARFVEWLARRHGTSWLDVGCGTGALSETILEHASPERVVDVDLSFEYLKLAKRRLTSAGVRFIVARAQQLPFPADAFDAVVSGLALNFVPTPGAVVSEMRRVARQGAVVAVYLWDYAGAMQLIRYFWDAAVALDKDAAAMDEGQRFPLCSPDRLEALFRESGLEDVVSRPIDVPTHFIDFDDYWLPFLGAQGPAPGYVMTLNEERRGRLRDTIRHALPVAKDGSIALTARAWAVRGTKPGKGLRR